MTTQQKRAKSDAEFFAALAKIAAEAGMAEEAEQLEELAVQELEKAHG